MIFKDRRVIYILSNFNTRRKDRITNERTFFYIYFIKIDSIYIYYIYFIKIELCLYLLYIFRLTTSYYIYIIYISIDDFLLYILYMFLYMLFFYMFEKLLYFNTIKLFL